MRKTLAVVFLVLVFVASGAVVTSTAKAARMISGRIRIVSTNWRVIIGHPQRTQ